MSFIQTASLLEKCGPVQALDRWEKKKHSIETGKKLIKIFKIFFADLQKTQLYLEFEFELIDSSFMTI